MVEVGALSLALDLVDIDEEVLARFVEGLASARPEMELLGCVGRGGMGYVFRAHHRGLDRPLAVKILSDGLRHDDAAVERFQAEARVLAGLDHPGIVRVYDFGLAGGQPFLVMEWVDGSNLRARLRGRPEASNHEASARWEAQAFDLTRDVAAALAYAHARGVVHRDIKPENILVGVDGDAKLADFGLARLQAELFRDTRGERGFEGTPNYAAPEQLRPSGALGPAADVFALGVVLYELLTGQLPVGRFSAPTALGVGSAEADAVIFRALAADVRERPRDGNELLQLLDTLTTIPPEAREAAAPEASARPPKPAWTHFVLALVGVALLAVLAAVWAGSKPGSKPGSNPGSNMQVDGPREAALGTGSDGDESRPPSVPEDPWLRYALSLLGTDQGLVVGMDWSNLRRSAFVRTLLLPWVQRNTGFPEGWSCSHDLAGRTHRVVLAVGEGLVPLRIVVEGAWGREELVQCMSQLSEIMTSMTPLSGRDLTPAPGGRVQTSPAFDLGRVALAGSPEALGWTVVRADGVTVIDFGGATADTLESEIRAPPSRPLTARIERAATPGSFAWFALGDARGAGEGDVYGSLGGTAPSRSGSGCSAVTSLETLSGWTRFQGRWRTLWPVRSKARPSNDRRPTSTGAGSSRSTTRCSTASSGRTAWWSSARFRRTHPHREGRRDAVSATVAGGSAPYIDASLGVCWSSFPCMRFLPRAGVGCWPRTPVRRERPPPGSSISATRTPIPCVPSQGLVVSQRPMRKTWCRASS